MKSAWVRTAYGVRGSLQGAVIEAPHTVRILWANSVWTANQYRER
jgi:hypothetical protein